MWHQQKKNILQLLLAISGHVIIKLNSKILGKKKSKKICSTYLYLDDPIALSPHHTYMILGVYILLPRVFINYTEAVFFSIVRCHGIKYTSYSNWMGFTPSRDLFHFAHASRVLDNVMVYWNKWCSRLWSYYCIPTLWLQYPHMCRLQIWILLNKSNSRNPK